MLKTKMWDAFFQNTYTINRYEISKSAFLDKIFEIIFEILLIIKSENAMKSRAKFNQHPKYLIHKTPKFCND